MRPWGLCHSQQERHSRSGWPNASRLKRIETAPLRSFKRTFVLHARISEGKGIEAAQGLHISVSLRPEPSSEGLAGVSRDCSALPKTLGFRQKQGKTKEPIMSDFCDCIVSLIDMIGVRDLLDRGDRKAVTTMRRMHAAVIRAAAHFDLKTEICFWNDSVLIHSLVNESDTSYASAMCPLVEMKAAIDAVRPSYCICVKGQSFPSPDELSKRKSDARLVYLSASSLAFTNCFDVEYAVRKAHYEKDWYLDNRIVRKIRTLSRKADLTATFSLYPRGSQRVFHMFRGSFLVKHR